jgi:tetratricopeptide (TPR) repeat protein
LRSFWLSGCGVIALLAAAQSDQPELSLKREAERNPQSFEANHRLGEYFVQQKNFSSAVVYLGKAYQIDSSAYDNAYDLALSQLLAGDTVSSRRLVEQMLARQDRPDLHNLLGSIEEASGNFREAAKQYESAARQDPSEKNLFDLGTELLKYHGYRQAVQVFEYAVGRYPKSAQLRVSFGVAQYSLGEYRAAVETLCRAVDLDPKDARALDFLGKMYDVAPGLSAEVTSRLKHFSELYPNNPAANYYYALALERAQTSNTALVESLLKRAIAEDPSYTEAHYQLGLTYANSGSDRQAIAELEKAIQLRPDLKSAHYRLAQLYAKQGDKDRAQREYQAVRALPSR